MSDAPALSVLTAVYNGADFLEATLASVLGQDFRDFEWVVVDDGSTDQTPRILADAAVRDGRLRVLTHDANRGLTPSLNRGLEAVRAPLVARQDADDLSLPGRFSAQVAYMRDHPACVLLSGHLERIDEAGRVIDRVERETDPVLVRYLLHFWNHLAGHSQVVFRTDAARAAGGYDATLPCAQDYDLWSRLAEGGSVAVLDRLLLRYRLHAGSVSRTRGAQQRRIAVETARRNQEALLGAPVSFEEAELAMAFFEGRLDEVTGREQALQTHLQRATQAFLANERDPQARRRIGRLLAGRWYDLLQIAGLRAGGPFFRHAWEWAPAVALGRMPVHLLRAIGRRAARRGD